MQNETTNNQPLIHLVTNFYKSDLLKSSNIPIALLKAQVTLQLGISSENEVSVYMLYSYIYIYTV